MGQTPSFADRLARAERLIGEFLERSDSPPDSTAFEALVRENPGIELELRELHAAATEIDRALDEGRQQHIAEQARVAEILSELGQAGGDRERYRLEGEVGKGGMGVVYRVRDTRFDRPLAMKVILGQADVSRSGKTPPIQVRQLARFVNEARITGQLEHPGIVPVHEVGVDLQGRAFFTMKLVQGITLADAFERHAAGDSQWSTARVLGVIERVCEALAFAHERDVIHRDLKPSNVMAGDFGEVYVMDWGLARKLGDAEPDPEASAAIEDELGAQANRTREGSVLGTPAYMSPEQARGEIGDMDPRSDVYAIGAMLYHLIAGHAPYAHPGSSASAERVLAELAKGPPPRLALHSSPPELAAIAERAMAYDRGARYANVSELADDLRRFVEGRAVHAFKTGGWVEFKKWVQRNRALSAALAAVVLVSITGAIGFAVQANLATRAARLATEEGKRADSKALESERNAARARENAESARVAQVAAQQSALLAEGREKETRAALRRAEKITEFVQDALENSDPWEGGEQDYRVADAMEKARKQLDDGSLKEDPETEAALQYTLARILHHNGKQEEALCLALQSLETRQRLFPAGDLSLAKSLSQAGHMLRSAGQPEAALAMSDAACEMQLRLAPEQLDRVAACVEQLGGCMGSIQRRAEQSWMLNAALALELQSDSATESDRAFTCSSIASMLRVSGQAGPALDYARRAADLLDCLGETKGPAFSQLLGVEGACLEALGEFEEALSVREEALAIIQHHFGGVHPEVASALQRVSRSLYDMGRNREAIERAGAAFTVFQAVTPEGSAGAAECLDTLARCVERMDGPARALPLYRAALEMRRDGVQSWNMDIATSMCDVASCLQGLGRHSEALPLYASAIDLYSCDYPDGHPYQITTMEWEANCLEEMGRGSDALPVFERALEMRRRLTPDAKSLIGLTMHNLAHCLYKLGRTSDALPLELEALDRFQEGVQGDHAIAANIHDGIANCQIVLGELAEAFPHYEASAGIYRRLRGELDPIALGEEEKAATCLYQLGRRAEALERFESLSARREKLGIAEDLHKPVLWTLSGICLSSLGRREEALVRYQAALDFRRAHTKGDSRGIVESLRNVNSTLTSLKRFEEALPVAEEAFEMQTRLASGDSPEMLSCLDNLSRTLEGLGRAPEALEYATRADQMAGRILREDDSRRAMFRKRLTSLRGPSSK